MRPLPFSVPGLRQRPQREGRSRHAARGGRREALVYAFGERWGPETGVKDKYFGFLPGNGIHDIHMNQGNSRAVRGDDGVFQDGGLLVHFPDQHEWIAIFLKFQSQTWHTDDKTGHSIAAEARAADATPSRADATASAAAPAHGDDRKGSCASLRRWSTQRSRRRSRW